MTQRFEPAINGTGTILHTGLGRAPLATEALLAVQELAQSYCTLEIETATGQRGSRNNLLVPLLQELTGAEDSAVVNNNAAAVLLILATFATGREVVVARSQLVEIGGAFRLPDVMAKSGVVLVEVGAINRVTVEDYRAAINQQTALLLAVHRSNFQIVGEFTEPSLEDLVALGQETGLAVVHDLGSGNLVDLSRFGLPEEPTVADSVAAGVDLTCFSGDKLLGGPQAGIIVGRSALLTPLKTNPLMRALRVDKMTLAALEATLCLFRKPDTLSALHPVLALLAQPVSHLRDKAQGLAQGLIQALDGQAKVAVIDGTSQVGGGSAPNRPLSTQLVEILPTRGSNRELATFFRRHRPPIFGRLQGDALVFDVRTLADEDLPVIVARATLYNKNIEK